MGRSYLFECSKCSYRTTVSGGVDHGLDFSVQTAVCRDCRRVFDAVIRLRVAKSPGTAPLKRRLEKSRERPVAPPRFEDVVNRLPLPTAASSWREFDLRCPSNRSHKVQPWTDPGKCPICGAFLEKSGVAFHVWE